MGAGALSRGAERPRREANHSPVPSSKIKLVDITVWKQYT